jgi:hypothetical protein
VLARDGQLLDEASARCPAGYVVLDRADSSGTVVVASYGYGYGSAVARPRQQGEILIECR